MAPRYLDKNYLVPIQVAPFEFNQQIDNMTNLEITIFDLQSRLTTLENRFDRIENNLKKLEKFTDFTLYTFLSIIFTILFYLIFIYPAANKNSNN